MSKKDKPETKHPELDAFIPRGSGPVRRHMVACEPEAYDFITQLAEELDTSRNRIVTALVEFYRAEPEE